MTTEDSMSALRRLVRRPQGQTEMHWELDWALALAPGRLSADPGLFQPPEARLSLRWQTALPFGVHPDNDGL